MRSTSPRFHLLQYQSTAIECSTAPRKAPLQSGTLAQYHDALDVPGKACSKCYPAYVERIAAAANPPERRPLK